MIPAIVQSLLILGMLPVVTSSAQDLPVLNDKLFSATLVEVKINATARTNRFMYSELEVVRSFGNDDRFVGKKFQLDSCLHSQMSRLGPPLFSSELEIGEHLILWVREKNSKLEYDVRTNNEPYGLFPARQHEHWEGWQAEFTNAIVLGEAISRIRKSSSETECHDLLRTAILSDHGGLVNWAVDLMLRWRPAEFIPFLEETFLSDQYSMFTRLAVDRRLQEFLKGDWTRRENRHLVFKQMASTIEDTDASSLIGQLQLNIQIDSRYSKDQSEGQNRVVKNNLELIQILFQSWEKLGIGRKTFLIELCSLLLSRFPTTENKSAIEALLADALPKIPKEGQDVAAFWIHLKRLEDKLQSIGETPR